MARLRLGYKNPARAGSFQKRNPYPGIYDMLIMDEPHMTSPRPAAILFSLTMAIGFVGVFFGIYTGFFAVALLAFGVFAVLNAAP
jgi:hypothetical protein